jgi:hypothetical protein
MRFKAKNPITVVEMEDHLQYHHNISVLHDTLRHFISRISGVHTVIGVSMEAERVETSNEDIKQWYKEHADLISDGRAEFIYIMDETGCSEFADSCEMTVLVPDEYRSSEIFIPLDRHSKRSTLSGCISADGKVLKPCVIIDRVAVDDQLILSGYGPSTAEFVTQKNAFMTIVLFDKWA